MGNVCGNQSAEQKEAKSASHDIDEELKKVRKQAETRVKLLLLGTGDSGKSTFAKQMTVLHSTGFSEEKYQRFQKVLRDNCLTSMQKILSSFQENRIRLEKGTSKHTEVILSAADLTPSVAGMFPLPPSLALGFSSFSAFELHLLLLLLVSICSS